MKYVINLERPYKTIVLDEYGKSLLQPLEEHDQEVRQQTIDECIQTVKNQAKKFNIVYIAFWKVEKWLNDLKANN